jgi:hypothetical protein
LDLIRWFTGTTSLRATEIAAIKTSWGSPVGIYGAGPCRLCGAMETYRAFTAALFVAHVDGRLICRRCRDRLRPPQAFGITARNEVIRTELAACPHRYCECCTAPYPMPQEGWSASADGLCDRCLAAFQDAGVEDMQEFLLLLRRVRYIELTCPTPQALGGFGRGMKRAREEVEAETLPPGYVTRITVGHGIEIERRPPGSI